MQPSCWMSTYLATDSSPHPNTHTHAHSTHTINMGAQPATTSMPQMARDLATRTVGRRHRRSVSVSMWLGLGDGKGTWEEARHHDPGKGQDHSSTHIDVSTLPITRRRTLVRGAVP